jgi:hypothetical protein
MKHLASIALSLLVLPAALASCSEDGSSDACEESPNAATCVRDGGGLATALDASSAGMSGGAAGAGGAAAGAGGAAAGAGGAAAGAGGAAAGAGGAAAGAGGAAAGAGGAAAGAGGAAAGAGGATGGSLDAGGTAGGDATTPEAGTGTPEAGSAGGGGNLEPIIPEIVGECPTIKPGTSTVTVNGSRATVIAGEKKDGTGSLLHYYYGTGKLGGVSSLPAAVKNDITAQGGIVFALQEAKNTGGDCSGTGTFGIDDFKTADLFTACAVKNYGINPRRIYATGCSAGGLTSGCMAIRRSKYIAGVAPNSGGVTIGYGKIEDPTRVPNVITMNGGAGDNVIVNFGETSEGFDNWILKHGGFAVNCIHSSGHCGAPAALYQSAWQFLKDHPFGTKPSPYANGLPSGFHSSCKVFTMTGRAPLGGF